MANEHEVTIHIWRNSPNFEIIQDDQNDRTRYAQFNSGHASLKLQRQGAAKGDYLFLSFWPGQLHSMTISYGAASKNIKLQNNPHALATQLDSTDVGIEGKKADRTYRFTGPNFDAMRNFIHSLGNNPDNKWSLKKNNCAEVIASCLEAGGAPNKPPFTGKFTPNRLEAWCKTLVKHFGGEKKNVQTEFITPYFQEV